MKKYEAEQKAAADQKAKEQALVRPAVWPGEWLGPDMAFLAS
jgi:hypothetical protein